MSHMTLDEYYSGLRQNPYDKSKAVEELKSIRNSVNIQQSVLIATPET